MINKHNKISFKNKLRKNFLSIIIPTYKDAIGLKETLISVYNQNYKFKNYEIIIVNDDADEETSKICQKFKVKLIRLDKNYGQSFARNKGLEISEGEYIAFLDSDIIVCKNWLQNAFLHFTNYDYFGGKVSLEKKETNTLTESFEIYTAFNNKNYLKKDGFLGSGNLFTKRYVIEKIGGFDVRLRSSEDYEFGNRVNIANYKQAYIENIKVYHKPRNYKQLCKKIKRLSNGKIKLFEIYPERFAKNKKILLFYSVIKIFIPPKKINWPDYKFCFLKKYFFSWWIKIIYNIYSIKLLLINYKKLK